MLTSSFLFFQSKYSHIADDQVSIAYFYAGSKKIVPEVSLVQ